MQRNITFAHIGVMGKLVENGNKLDQFFSFSITTPSTTFCKTKKLALLRTKLLIETCWLVLKK
jgi:hypothetical protein